MKTYAYKKFGKFAISLGWFSGELFILFRFVAFENLGKATDWTLLEIQITKFCFTLSWYETV